MPSYNKLILMGHMARDLQTKTLPGGTTIAEGGIAVNEKSRDGDRVMFLDFIAFEKAAEQMCKWFSKGDAVLIEGRLQLDQWQDKDGNKRSKHKMVVDRWTFSGKTGPAETPPKIQDGEAPGGTSATDIPF